MSYLFAPDRRVEVGFVLRSYEPGDGALLSDAANESHEHLRRWISWSRPHQPVKDSESLVRQFRGRYLLAEDFVIGIFSPDETRLLGGTGFHLREGPVSTKSAELGMFIRASEAHRGLGSAVLASMLAWGFTDWPWLRLSWRCDQGNAASMRIAEKCGLRHEGVLRGQPADVGDERRDTVCYGLTKNDWLARSGH